MSILEEPRIKINTLDYSQTSPRISSDLNIAMPVSTPTGPIGITKVENLSDFVKNFLTNNSITANDDITIKHAAKLLQSSPIYVSRVFGNKVLPGMTNNGNACYTDLDFEPFYEKTKIEVKEKAFKISPLFICLTAKGSVGEEKKCFYANSPIGFIQDGYESVRIYPELDSISTEDFLLGFNAELAKIPGMSHSFFFTEASVVGEYVVIRTSTGTTIDEISPEIAFSSIEDKTPSLTKVSFKVIDTTEQPPKDFWVNKGDEVVLNSYSYYYEGDNDFSKQFLGTQVPFQSYQGNLDKAKYAKSIRMPFFFYYTLDKAVSSDSFYPMQLGRQNSISLKFPTTVTLEIWGGSDNIKKNSLNELSIGGSVSMLKDIAIRIVKKDGSFVVVHSGDISKAPSSFNPTNSKCKASFDCREVYTENTFLLHVFEWFNLADFYNEESASDGIYFGADLMLSYLRDFVVDGDILPSLTFMFEDSSIEYQVKFDDAQEPRFAIDTIITNPVDKNVLSLVYTSSSLDSVQSSINNIDSAITSTVQTEKVNSSAVSFDSLNSSSKLLEDVWVMIDNGDSKTVFYNGSYYTPDPDVEKVKLSSSALPYLEWLTKFRTATSKIFRTTNSPFGITLFDYETGSKYTITAKEGAFESVYSIKDGSFFIDVLPTEVVDMSANKLKDCFAIISRFPNKTKICKFSITQDIEDTEVYSLALSRKSTQVSTYQIAFKDDVVDGYGSNIYCNYINELDENYYLLKFDNDLLPKDFSSPLFGNEVPITEPGSEDYVESLNRLLDFDGTYYSFVFDGGYINQSVGNTVANIASALHATALVTLPDFKEKAKVIDYRNKIAITDWHTVFNHPHCIDQTIGDFITYISPQVPYFERILDNSRVGREFAPVFGLNNGVINSTPKYEYTKKQDREELLGSQINLIYFDKARSTTVKNLDLTAQKKTSSLSTCNNTRMINEMSHIADHFLAEFIGEFNTEKTRSLVVEGLTSKIESRLVTNQIYSPNDFIVVCNTSNNTTAVLENNELVVDILIKFESEIRYINVYNKVYKLSQDLNEV